MRKVAGKIEESSPVIHNYCGVERQKVRDVCHRSWLYVQHDFNRAIFPLLLALFSGISAKPW